MADVALALLWHQHQPYYPDDVSGENPMPWVRLHGVKDYYGMALHLLEYPAMRCTINLVPSLLAQLLQYTDGGRTDRPFDLSRANASGLNEDDALYLLDHFFMASAERMIKPLPRYHELYQRRAAGKNTAREALRRFAERDLRDLQVLFNLAWVHPIAFERDEGLRALRDKGRNFSEAEKHWLLDKHLAILREIIPLHRQLAERGQVELTTTPFYHPILPLLFDKKLAREAMPDVKLPRYAGGYPDDATVHVRRAVHQHEALFGKAPAGMWPSEGSVCQPMLPLLAQHGIRWIATDEGVLSQSTQGFVSRDGQGNVRNPRNLYRPYLVREGDAELAIVFRDHALSDRIGFHYQRSPGPEAAQDFVRHLHGIRAALPEHEPALVSVILDGENCWEHYPDGGVPFLRSLYRLCTSEPGLHPVTISEYLERHPPQDTLPRLSAGSWINHNFAIWIGHDEDNTAWDALHRAREYLKEKTKHLPAKPQDESSSPGGPSLAPLSPAGRGEPGTPGARRLVPGLGNVGRAWEELYIAEGSDWFWWYGDDHSSAQDMLFDYLFRKHLQNVYTLLGDAPPADLHRPIKRRGQRPIHTLPLSFLDVKVDGRETFFEWVNAGRYTCQNERGTMAMVTRGPLRDVYFGFSLTKLLVRVDFDQPARQAMGAFDALRVGFEEPRACEISIDPSGGARWVRSGEPADGAGIEVGIDRVVELALPFELLPVEVSQPIQFFVELIEAGQSRDRAPREGNIQLTRPSDDFERIMWDV